MAERRPGPSALSTSRRRLLGISLIAAALAAGTACDSGSLEPRQSEELPRIAEISSSFTPEKPFYWFSGEKIFLEVVPGLFVVRPRSGDPVEVVRRVLATTQLGPVERELDLGDGHAVVSVAEVRPDPVTAHAVARILHDHSGLTFASPAYRGENGGSRIFPLDVVLVKFEEEASRAEIDALNDELGTTVQRSPEGVPGLTWYSLRYPESGDRDVLWIAAAYAEHPLVEWADPNKVAERRFHAR